MFKIIAKEEIIEKIESALSGKFQEMGVMFPGLKEKIMEKMLWGIFSNEFFYAEKENDKRRHDYLTYFSYDLINLAEKELEKAGESQLNFFVQEVKDIIKGKSINIFLDYEDCDVLVEETEKDKKLKEQELIIAMTLPDSGIVFEDFIDGHWFDDKNQWIIEYMDAYDEFKYELMGKLYQYYVQIGGHGRWIQSDYNGSYVGQLNIDIGDCGSVFIDARDGEIKGIVDMY